MTRRGRLAATLSVSTLLLLASAVTLSAALATAGPAPARAASGAPAVTAGPTQARVVVLPGDTLWSIADEVAVPGEDLRDVVLAIQELNGLPSVALSVGDSLVVPV